MRLPRTIHHLYARARGYGWGSCPICTKPFGSHEHRDSWLLTAPSTATMACPDCPGYWVVSMGRYCQIKPVLNTDGEVTTHLVFGCSGWKRQPQPPSMEELREQWTRKHGDPKPAKAMLWVQ